MSCINNSKQEADVVLQHSPEFTRPIEIYKPIKVSKNQDTIPTFIPAKNIVNETDPGNLLIFAKSLIGIPYKYGSTDPLVGFDCSGFITYVFHHFNIDVPRSSVDFTNVGMEVGVSHAQPGDLILFTGTDSTIRTVGHMGIVVENIDTLKFIHSTSGKIYGVTITPLNNYYKGRFMKVTRIFNDH